MASSSKRMRISEPESTYAELVQKEREIVRKLRSTEKPVRLHHLITSRSYYTTCIYEGTFKTRNFETIRKALKAKCSCLMGKSALKNGTHDLHITLRRYQNQEPNFECRRPLDPKRTLELATTAIETMLNCRNQSHIIYISFSWRQLLETGNAASDEVRDLMQSTFDVPASPPPPDSGEESGDEIELL